MIVDLIIAAVLLISAIIAFFRGFIREVLTIAGVVGGLAAAYFAGPQFAPIVRGWLGVVEGEEVPELFDIVPYTLVGDILAYASIFLFVLIVLSIISNVLAKAARSIGLGAVDRSLGVVFGLARGALLLALLYLPLHHIVSEETRARWFEGSRSYFYLAQSADILGAYLPEETVKKIEEDGKKASDVLSTREKLQNMDILQREQGTDGPEDQGSDQPGYNEGFRDQMDRLFEQETEQNNSPQGGAGQGDNPGAGHGNE